jgi:hypothetical protein
VTDPITLALHELEAAKRAAEESRQDFRRTWHTDVPSHVLYQAALIYAADADRAAEADERYTELVLNDLAACL